MKTLFSDFSWKMRRSHNPEPVFPHGGRSQVEASPIPRDVSFLSPSAHLVLQPPVPRALLFHTFSKWAMISFSCPGHPEWSQGRSVELKGRLAQPFLRCRLSLSSSVASLLGLRSPWLVFLFLSRCTGSCLHCWQHPSFMITPLPGNKKNDRVTIIVASDIRATSLWLAKHRMKQNCSFCMPSVWLRVGLQRCFAHSGIRTSQREEVGAWTPHTTVAFKLALFSYYL